MPRKINADNCVGCGTCAGACPVGAIVEDGGVYTIDSSACIDCGACESECPTESISEE